MGKVSILASGHPISVVSMGDHRGSSLSMVFIFTVILQSVVCPWCSSCLLACDHRVDVSMVLLRACDHPGRFLSMVVDLAVLIEMVGCAWCSSWHVIIQSVLCLWCSSWHVIIQVALCRWCSPLHVIIQSVFCLWCSSWHVIILVALCGEGVHPGKWSSNQCRVYG